MQTLQKYLLKKNSLNQNNIFDSQSISVTKNSIINSSTSFNTQYHNNIQEGGNQTDLKKKTHYEVSNFINNDISRFENTEVESVSDSDTSVFLNNTAKHLNQLTGGNVELNKKASTEEFLDYVENKLNNNLTGGDINNILQDSFMKGINKGGYIDNDTITQQDILNRLKLYVSGNQTGGGIEEEDEDITDTYTDTDTNTDTDTDTNTEEKNDEEEETTSTEEEEIVQTRKNRQHGGRRKNNSSDSSSSSSSDNDSSDSSSSSDEKSSSIKLKIKSKRLKNNDNNLIDKLSDKEDDDESDEDDDEDDEDEDKETKEKTKRSVNKIDHITVLGSEDDEDDEDDESDEDDDDSSDEDDKDELSDEDDKDESSDNKKNKKVNYSADSLSSIIISSSKESITPYMMSSDNSLHTDEINLISFSPKNIRKNKRK